MNNLTKRSIKSKPTEELQSLKGRLKILFENAPDPIFLYDVKGGLIDCNKAVKKLVGYKKEELIGKRFSAMKLLPPSQIPKVVASLAKTARGEPSKVELTLVRKDGKQVVVETRVFPMKIKGQIQVIGIARDITERKKAEEKIKQEKEKVERYLDIVGNIVVTLDINGKIVSLNKKGYEILGYKEGELLGKNWFKTFVPKENRKEVERIYKKDILEETKRVENYEYPILAKKRGEKIISWSITWLKDNQGKIRGILSSGQDIALRKEAEEALKESEEKYATLVEKGNDGIIIVQSGALKFINEKLTEITGFAIEETLRKKFIDFVSPPFKKLVADRYKKRLMGKKVPERYEIEILSKDGRKIPVEINASLIEYEGKPADMAIIRDITEYKEMEKQIFESNKRLQQAAQELRVAIETKGEFMNIAAHELRTPLQPIIGYADRILKKGNPTDWQKERLNIILDNAKNLLKLVQDVLDINKMETGIMKFSMEEADLLKIIRDAYDSFKPAVEERGFKFILDIPKISGGIKIKGDPSRLNQVFSNLLDNAVKFTDKGIIAIHIKEDKKTVTISVQDTGVGVAKKDIPKLFTKFFQADVTDKRKGGGTGLGLAICKQIVKAHQGKISVQSTLGKGSTFQVVLPKLVRSS